jgi:hypothetical protein
MWVHQHKHSALFDRISLNGISIFEEELRRVLPVDRRDQIEKQVVESFLTGYDLRIADSDFNRF